MIYWYVAAVFAYVLTVPVVFGYFTERSMFSHNDERYPASIFWPLAMLLYHGGRVVVGAFARLDRLGERLARRRTELPEARVVRELDDRRDERHDDSHD